MNRLLGLVLAGGKSMRMKQPKALLDFGKGPQWKMASDLLSVCDDVFFSLSSNFNEIPVSKSKIIWDENDDCMGPLGGIISALNAYKGFSFFVLACDLPLFDNEAVAYLLARRNSNKCATVFTRQGKIEPLCAIYEPSILPILVRAKIEKNYCPRAILSTLDVEKISPLTEAWLTNLNHDFERLQFMKEHQEKRVRVQYFALLKDEAQKSTEELCTKAQTLGVLFDELRKKYNFSLQRENICFAKNNQMVKEDSPLYEGDEVVFIPPVSGG